MREFIIEMTDEVIAGELDADLEPDVIDKAGFAGEHNASRLIFCLPESWQSEWDYRIECSNSSNEGTPSDTLSVTAKDGKRCVIFDIPQSMTKAGISNFTLQATERNGEEVVRIFRSATLAANFEKSTSLGNKIVDKLTDVLSGLFSKINGLVERFNKGEFNGATFTPSVSQSGDLSWSNDKGFSNPPTVNIKGEKGEKGDSSLTVYHTLPTDATDGDVCLYAPANTITPEMSGQRILLDLEELAKPTEHSSLVYADLYSQNGEHVLSMQFTKEYNGEDTASYHFVSIENKLTNTSFFCSLLDGVFDGASFTTFDADGNTIESIEYESFEDVPRYYELPEFASAEIYIEGLEFTAFHLPYRLVCFQGGQWTELSSGGDTDLTDIIRQIEQNRKLIDGIVAELPCIPTVRTLPEDSTDGDMCLYSPANVITPEMSGKRIYFDWEEFANTIDDDDGIVFTISFSNESTQTVGNITLDRGPEECGIKKVIYGADFTEDLQIVFVGGSFSTEASYYSFLKDDISEEKYYTSVEELPKYIDLPVWDWSEFYWNENTDIPLFYAPYRLMVYQGGNWTEISSGSNIDLSNYYTKSEIDNKGFITKTDIPTDESYELIGETPLTLTEKSNIKLESAVETTYEAKTPTVWDFDDTFANGDYTLTKCTLEREDDHYKLVSDATVTAWYQTYLRFLIPVEIGKTYTLFWDNSASKKEPNTTATDWGGSITIYSGEDTSTLLKSGHIIDELKPYTFTAQHDVIQIRYCACSGLGTAPKANVIARFNAMWLDEGEETKLTEPYNISGTFNGSITLPKVPEGATVTATPTAKVYVKSPTDKTLSKSDVPADAKATGERIEAVKNLLPLYSKTIVNFGDSIFGNAQPPVDISTHLANKTGATVYNCGFGGCRMTPHPTAWYDAFCMYNLADAIATKDFTQQNEAVASGNLAERYSVGLERLKNIDFSNVDIVTIAYGTNDYYGNGATLDNEENPLDVSTFGGALRYSIETLLSAYPNLRIFVLSIAYRFFTDENNEFVDDSNTHANNYGKFIRDYNTKLQEVAAEYNLPYVDDYNIGIGKFNRLQYFNANDGAHHKETGRRLIAEHLATALSMGNNIPDSSIDKVTLSTSSAKLNANKLYDFGVATELTITFANNDPTKYNEYSFTFTSGATPTVLTLPSSVKWVNELTVEPNKRYEISVVDNIGLWCAVEVSV